MPTTFTRCPAQVTELAADILTSFDTHRPLLDAKVKIDYVFAHAERDEKTGQPKGPALKKNGIPAMGIARKVGLKDRAKGMGDAEICLDADHWEGIGEADRRALLDHELHHLAIKIDKRGLVRDDLGRPVIQIRLHDVDIGWFAIIAQRHGKASFEVQQARQIMDDHGQFFWPEMVK